MTITNILKLNDLITRTQTNETDHTTIFFNGEYVKIYCNKTQNVQGSSLLTLSTKEWTICQGRHYETIGFNSTAIDAVEKYLKRVMR